MKPTHLFYGESEGVVHSFTNQEARTWAETDRGWALTPRSPQYLGSAYPQVQKALAYKRIIHHEG